MSKCYVLDATALIQGLTPTALSHDAFTVPAVIDEVNADPVLSIRIEAAIASGTMKYRLPSGGSIAAISEIVRDLGEEESLSETDLELLALAIELRTEGWDVSLISDDYAIQNVSTKIGIPFVTVAASGITLVFTWSLFCPACRRTYPHGKSKITCPVCGTTLKRRVVKKRRI
jgi:UPF0271 protein